MVEGLIGKKIGMTQIFDGNGNVIPVTLVKAGPCTVVQKKEKNKDGYKALQLGFIEERSYKKDLKPKIGHFEKSGVPPTRVLREFSSNELDKIKEGEQYFVDIFQVGEKVNVVGLSKGKGFSGVIKRWGFKGGKKTHGSMFHRHPGSIGASADPSKVAKGKKLPGHSGHKGVTVKNLTVVDVKKEENLIVIKGAIPGANKDIVLIKKKDFQPSSIKMEKKSEQ